MTAFIHSLEAEAKTAEKFVELLKLERDALLNGDLDQLNALVSQKSDAAAELQGYSETKNALLSSRGLGTDRSGVEAWLEAHASNQQAKKTWSHLLSLAEEARELNRVNGELINLRIQYNSQALETLLGGSGQPKLYGPDGQSAQQSNRRINDAA